MVEGSWVGLDVHARTTLAGVLDAGSGELRVQRVSPRSEETVAWLETLPRAGAGRLRGGADRVRACARLRGGGDRVHGRGALEDPARGGRSGQDRPPRRRAPGAAPAPGRARRGAGCPSPEEEAARDLVRAREDARGDLMRARHRLSKLLLRHGLVYEGSAWTLAHDAWLRRQRFESRPLALAFDECYGAVAQAKGRRTRSTARSPSSRPSSPSPRSSAGSSACAASRR